jgi:Uma2 family endonuclease
MSIAPTPTRFSADDLLRMPDGDRYELVDGNLVERTGGSESSWVGGHLSRILGNYCDEHHLGWVWPADNGFQCFADFPETVRKPDVSFLRYGRLPGEQLPKGFVPIPPDLAVEVVSPNDLVYEIDRKVQEYLEAGVSLVWVVNPDTNRVRVYQAGGLVQELGPNDELTGKDVIPGFRYRVADLFPKPGP